MRHSEALSSDQISVSGAQGLLCLYPSLLHILHRHNSSNPHPWPRVVLVSRAMPQHGLTASLAPLQGSLPGFFRAPPCSAYNLTRTWPPHPREAREVYPPDYCCLHMPGGSWELPVLGQLFVWPWLLPLEWPESCFYPNSPHLSPHFRNRSSFLQMNPLGSTVNLGWNFRSGVTSFRILIPTPGGLSLLEKTHTRT